MSTIKIVTLGAGQDVGRSCILLSIAGKNIMLDCGMHMGFQDERRFPDFSYVAGGSPLTDYFDCIIISHFHLDHCGALPYMSEMIGYEGPIYMTYPTKAIAPVLLEDFRKVQTEYRGETNFFTSQMIKNCMKKVIAVNVNEEVWVDDKLKIRAFYAGHVLGAAMFLVSIGSESVLYTGDFNTTPDRHLGAAHVPPGLKPDLLITETTYATTIRDSKRARERDFLKKVHDCVTNGGKVLIPVFALGRAQELCILVESYWEQMNLNIPVYFSQGLAEKANQYYRLFINWTNEKIKQTFVHRNMFDFKHIRPHDNSYTDNPGPMVLFSTPGMLHGGQSLKVFKHWCSDEKNMVIMPGFCVAGTVGAKVISGAKKIEIDGKMFDINLGVEYMSFSAHADAKGIMQVIRQCEPRNVMFVHGENAKMEFLKEKVEKELGIPVYKPANGETICLERDVTAFLTVPSHLIERSIALDPTSCKRYCPFRAFTIMDKQSNQLEVMSVKSVVRQFNCTLHTITFSDTIQLDEVDWNKIAQKLKRFDANLNVKQDGLEMFDGEVVLAEVGDKMNEVEIIWNVMREEWFNVIRRALTKRYFC